MSKRRNSTPEIPRYLRSISLTHQNPQNHQLTQKNLSFGQKSKGRTLKTESTADSDTLSTIFNKNISKFRDLVNCNDNSLLPFLSSLRQDSQINKVKRDTIKKTILHPFAVAEKLTCNQKLAKDQNDIKGRTKRVSIILYRWHNKTGLGIKNSCQFQSKLRETSMEFYKKNTFLNLFNPIETRLVEQKKYKADDLICRKQRRLFTVQN